MDWQKIWNSPQPKLGPLLPNYAQVRKSLSQKGQIKGEYHIYPDNKLELLINNEAYEIIPINKVMSKLDEILANPETALRGRDWLYMRVCDLKLVGIIRTAMQDIWLVMRQPNYINL